MVEVTFDHHAAHPEFVRLVSGENIEAARTVLASPTIRARNAAVAFAPEGPGRAPPFAFRGNGIDRVRARDCLALAAMAEAGGGDPDQRAVMQVILNVIDFGMNAQDVSQARQWLTSSPHAAHAAERRHGVHDTGGANAFGHHAQVRQNLRQRRADERRPQGRSVRADLRSALVPGLGHVYHPARVRRGAPALGSASCGRGGLSFGWSSGWSGRCRNRWGRGARRGYLRAAGRRRRGCRLRGRLAGEGRGGGRGGRGGRGKVPCGRG